MSTNPILIFLKSKAFSKYYKVQRTIGNLNKLQVLLQYLQDEPEVPILDCQMELRKALHTPTLLHAAWVAALSNSRGFCPILLRGVPTIEGIGVLTYMITSTPEDITFTFSSSADSSVIVTARGIIVSDGIDPIFQKID